MKLEYPKEWFERSAEIEGTSEVGAGCPAVPCSALVWCAAALQLVGRPADVIGVGGQPPRTIREMLDLADEDLSFGDPYAGLREAWSLLNATDLADRPQEVSAWLNHWAPVARILEPNTPLADPKDSAQRHVP